MHTCNLQSSIRKNEIRSKIGRTRKWFLSEVTLTQRDKLYVGHTQILTCKFHVFIDRGDARKLRKAQ